MLRAMRDIKDISNAYSGQIKVIFYYAGHGIPNEATKDAFLLPIDADGQQTEGCYSLNKLYTELGGLNANYVVVFLDACFSGAQRDGGMLASARGVALKAKQEDPKGNMVISALLPVTRLLSLIKTKDMDFHLFPAEEITGK